MTIPKIILQTHRDEQIGQEWRQSWIDHHRDYDYRFVDDDGQLSFMEEHFPNLVKAYNVFPLPVQKSDLFRYAYIFHHGGIYADVDTLCHAPFDSYVDMSKDHFVAGIEMSPFIHSKGPLGYSTGYCFPIQILQWTFAAPRQHPALGVMLNKIRYVAELLSPEQIHFSSRSQRFVLETTGPMMFTGVLMDFLNRTRKGGVTLLDQLAWGYTPWHNKIKLPDPKVKVQHLFDSSWKDEPAPNAGVDVSA